MQAQVAWMHIICSWKCFGSDELKIFTWTTLIYILLQQRDWSGEGRLSAIRGFNRFFGKYIAMGWGLSTKLTGHGCIR